MCANLVLYWQFVLHFVFSCTIQSLADGAIPLVKKLESVCISINAQNFMQSSWNRNIKYLTKTGSIFRYHNVNFTIINLWFVAKKDKLQPWHLDHHQQLQFQSAIFSQSLAIVDTMLKTGLFVLVWKSLFLLEWKSIFFLYLFQNHRRKRYGHWRVPMDGALGVFKAWDDHFCISKKWRKKWLISFNIHL